MEEQNRQENRLGFAISGMALVKYALPTILSSIFMNVYSLVDSMFVANLVSIEALSAVNIVWPALAVALAVGTMIATGGCALVSRQMGEGDGQGARENFSFFLLFAFAVSLALCLAGLAFREPLLHWMGADEALYPLCEAYAVPVFLIIPFAMIGMILQIFFVAAAAVVLSVLTFAASFPAARPLAALYARESAHVMAMSVEGIRIFAGAFLLMGFNMFASSMFTALNDGKTSAILSLLRTLVFLIVPLLILPRFWGVDGVWLSLPAAEVLAIAVSIYYFRTKRTVYHYA